MLLSILALGLAVGRWTHRISPAVDLLLFLGVAVVVIAQLMVWQAGVSLDLGDFLRGPGPGAR